MACALFEDRLLAYEELPPAERTPIDRHLACCADCREYLHILRQLESVLAAQYSGVSLSREIAAGVRARIAAPPPPSYLPELLDFLGGASVMTTVFSLAWLLLPQVRLQWPLAGACVALAVAAWIGVRAYADLK